MIGELIKKPMPAKQMVQWPGRADAPLCDEHLRFAIGMGAICGFMVTWIPCAETVCENCEYQFRYLTQDERDKVMKGFAGAGTKEMR